MFKSLELTPYTSTFGGLSGLSLQFAVAFNVTLAFWLFGYDMSVSIILSFSYEFRANFPQIMGGVITEESFLSVFPETRDATIQGLIIALLEVGALMGALFCLWKGDSMGRRATVWIGMGFMVIGGALQTSAYHVAQMGIGRVLSGFGLGLQVATVPTWQSECAKPKSRGKWVMIEGGLQTTGVACGQWVGYAFFFTSGPIQWRGPIGLQLIPAGIVFCSIMFLPESPRWLIKKGKIAQGVHNLCKLRGLSEEDPALIQERDSIIATFESQKSEAPFQYKELFVNGKSQTFRRMCLGFFIQA